MLYPLYATVRVPQSLLKYAISLLKRVHLNGSSPNTFTLSYVQSNLPAMIFISVDLPQPFNPDNT